MHITLTPIHRSQQVPGFLAKLEQQTLGKTPAKLNLMQLWFRRAMRLVKLLISPLGLGSGSEKWTTANTSSHYFLLFKLSRPTDPSGEERTHFPSLLTPDFLKSGTFFRYLSVVLRCQDLPYFWCSKCRAPHRPVVLELHSCGTHFWTNLYNLPHHST